MIIGKLAHTTYIEICDQGRYWIADACTLGRYRGTTTLSALKWHVDIEIRSNGKVSQHRSCSWLYSLHAANHESKKSREVDHIVVSMVVRGKNCVGSAFTQRRIPFTLLLCRSSMSMIGAVHVNAGARSLAYHSDQLPRNPS